MARAGHARDEGIDGRVGLDRLDRLDRLFDRGDFLELVDPFDRGDLLDHLGVGVGRVGARRHHGIFGFRHLTAPPARSWRSPCVEFRSFLRRSS